MDITSLDLSYKNKITSPTRVVREIYSQIRAEGKSPIWITLVDEEHNLARARELENQSDLAKLPLFGIPFAVKDNFDVAGLPTTAACPAYSRIANEMAAAVQRLLDAGAILIGKTNMDQFATGLVGTRTPCGICSSVFDEQFISGGSSSGSAVAVAKGLVSFSLGTDTAGSGRVPAAFNQLVGMKPTRGLVSTTGLLPACRTLDCVSVFAETCADAARVLSIIANFDASDPYSRKANPGEGATPWVASRFRFGVPTEDTLEFFGDQQARASYDKAIEAMTRLGGELVRFNYEPFRSAANLLYSGPWVAERLAALHDFAFEHADAMDPTVAKIVSGAQRFSAVDAFLAEYRLRELRRSTEAIFDSVDILLLPTTPTIYTIAEVQAAPIELNTNLGYYTNFVNLLDLAAVAIPSSLREDGLPFGVSLIGRAFTDNGLLAIADKLHREQVLTIGGSERLLAQTPAISASPAPNACILLAVVGAHLSGQPLNWQLTTRKARFVRTVRTLPSYQLYVLPNSTPAKPGLVYAPGFAGFGIELEVWAMPEDTVGTFLNGIPAPLSLGTVHLEDDTSVKGFLCEPSGIVGAEEITHLGGWRAYLEGKR
ncbi:allophanate hydrolase [Acidicapsa acidisoli]|uniref:allophanate hydrolase n=1 Tax=Acidicapsa acidisoli TaxID=1615681 RepID=UPI0021DFDE1E|nr:allophanate hydrolase [Acidicapsa acidisoli]